MLGGCFIVILTKLQNQHYKATVPIRTNSWYFLLETFNFFLLTWNFLAKILYELLFCGFKVVHTAVFYDFGIDNDHGMNCHIMNSACLLLENDNYRDVQVQ
jgi:hypothetical protein